MKYSIISETPIAKGGMLEIEVELLREIEGDKLPPITAQFYNKEKEECWWVVLGDPIRSVVLAIKRQIVGKCSKLTLKTKLNESGICNMKLYLICDSYMGCDQEKDIGVEVK